MKSYLIYEQFHSWQGEGLYHGVGAYFIRTFGCSVGCPWCDSSGTWEKVRPACVKRCDVESLSSNASASGVDICIITGGEPAMHDLTPLTDALKEKGLRVHLETSGGFKLKGNFDWVTVAPKKLKLPLEETLNQANEIKLIIEDQNDLDYWQDKIQIQDRAKKIPVWLHPEWSKREDPKFLGIINQAVRAMPKIFRAGYQIHKLYGAE